MKKDSRKYYAAYEERYKPPMQTVLVGQAM